MSCNWECNSWLPPQQVAWRLCWSQLGHRWVDQRHQCQAWKHFSKWYGQPVQTNSFLVCYFECTLSLLTYQYCPSYQLLAWLIAILVNKYICLQLHMYLLVNRQTSPDLSSRKNWRVLIFLKFWDKLSILCLICKAIGMRASVFCWGTRLVYYAQFERMNRGIYVSNICQPSPCLHQEVTVLFLWKASKHPRPAHYKYQPHLTTPYKHHNHKSQITHEDHQRRNQQHTSR